MSTDKDSIDEAVARLQQAVSDLFGLIRQQRGEDLTGFEFLVDRGQILFTYRLPGHFGWEPKYIHASEVADFVRDPVKFYAAEHDLTSEQYLEWMDAGERDGFGAVRCAARTKRGSRCKGWAGTARTAKEWFAMQGSLCAVHRGDRA